MRRFACAAALVIGLGLGAAGQEPPNFSGRWVLEPPAAAPDAPAAGTAGLRPDQRRLVSGDMGSGFSETLTISHDSGQLVIEQELFSRYDAYPQPRLVYALDGSESRNAVMISHAAQVRVSRAEWDGGALRITTRYPGVDPASGQAFTMDVVQRLSLESPTTLIVEVTRPGVLGGQATSARSVYRKR